MAKFPDIGKAAILPLLTLMLLAAPSAWAAVAGGTVNGVDTYTESSTVTTTLNIRNPGGERNFAFEINIQKANGDPAGWTFNSFSAVEGAAVPDLGPQGFENGGDTFPFSASYFFQQNPATDFAVGFTWDTPADAVSPVTIQVTMLDGFFNEFPFDAPLVLPNPPGFTNILPAQTDDTTTDPDNFNAENAVSAGGTLNFTIDIAPGVGGATVSTPVTVEFGSASFAADQWTVDDPATDTLNVSGDSSSGNFSWTFDGSRLDIDFAVPTDQTAKGQATTDQVFGFHIHAANTAGGTATHDTFFFIEPINQDPVIAATSPLVFDEEATGTIVISATDADPGETATLTHQVVSGPAVAGAVVGITAGGTGATADYTYTPPHDFFGSDTFTVSVSDTDGGSDTRAITVTVNPVNDPPTAADDTFALTEGDGATALDVLSNDLITPDSGETLTVISTGGTPQGTVTSTASGVTYTPPTADFFGADTFTYTIEDDGTGNLQATATVTVNVANVNDDPVADDDTDSMNEDDGPIVIDVLANDSILPDESETLDILSTSVAAAGTVAIIQGTPDTVEYDPAQDFVGNDTFSYTISDGNGGTATATVTVTVANVNDPPELSTTPVSATNFFLRQPDDPAASPLANREIDLSVFVSDVDFSTGHDLLADISYTITQVPARGSFVAGDAGLFTYTVDDAEKNDEFFDGNPGGNQADVILFTVNDGDADSGTGEIRIDYRSNVPPAVTAVSPGSDATTPQAQTIDEVDAEAAAVTLDFSVSGTDIDDPTNPSTGSDPNIASIAWCIDGGAAVQTDTGVTSSNYTFSTADTALHDTVSGDHATRVIEISAKITDGEGATTEVTWDVTVHDIDREPPPPTIAIQPATPMTLDDLSVLITEQLPDPDGDVVDSYTYTWAKNADREVIDTDINSGNVLESASSSAASGTGIYVIDTDNNLLHYTITFSGLEGDETAAHIHGFADVDAEAGDLEPLPLGSPKTGTWMYDEGDEANILAGLTYVNIHSTSVGDGEIRGQIYPASVDSVQAHAATSKNDQWTVTVTAITHPYNDAVEVTSESVSASVTIIDTPPDAVDDSSSGDEETVQAVVVTAIDPDADDGVDALTYSIITGPTAAQGTATIVDGDGTNGAAANEALLTFTPTADFATYPPGDPGSDTPVVITFQVQDNLARDASPTGTVSFTVNPVNDSPVAINGSIFAQHNTADSIPANTVDLFAGNNLPLGEDATLLGDDIDVDNDSSNLIYTVDSLPTKGTLSSVVATVATALTGGDLPFTVTDEMNLRYQPDVDQYGADTFLFSAEDNSGDSDQAEVELRIPLQPVVTAVSPGSDATTPQDQAINEASAAGSAVTVDFSVSATDINDPTNPNAGSGANIASITWSVDGGAEQTDSDVSSSNYAFSTADTSLYDTVIGDNTTRTIVITAKITDGEDATTAVTWNVTVTDVDRQPPAPSILIQPAAPMTLDDLSVLITEQLPDPDGDVIDDYTYAWSANAGPTASVDTVQPNAATHKNDEWTITVTAITHPYSDAVTTASDPASASVTILNTPPDAVDGVAADDEDTVQTIVVTAIDPDVDDGTDVLNYSILTGPTAAQGTATIVNGDGTNGAAANQGLLTYTPAQDFTTYGPGDPGGDVPVEITFQVQDVFAREISPNGTVSFTVHPLNDPPVAFTGSAFVQDNKVDTIPPNTVELYAGNNLPLDERATLLGDDVDPDNDSTDLIYTVDSLPVKGILSSVVGGIAAELTAGDLPLIVTDVMSLRYQPDVDENGTDTFLFSVQDIIGLTTQGQANLTIGTPQWTPPLNWIAPDLGGGVHPFFYLLTIQGGGLPAPLVGEIRDLDTTDNIVTVQPEFYFGAGSAGLLPGDYTFSWEYFDDDPTVNAFVEGESDVAVTVDDYGQPTIPNAPVVTEPAGRAVERNRIFTFLPENAAGWIMVIQRMDGGDWVDFLTLTESFSRDTSADELPAFPLNVTVSKTLFFTEPGTYQATVRGFNPLAPMPARGESDAHSDLFSDYSATFTVAAASPTDIAEKLPAPENLLAQLLGDEGDKTVRLTWTGVTSRYRVHLRARRGARILLTRAMRVNGTGITMPRTAADADQLVADGVVHEDDARLLRSLEEIFGDAKLVPNAYDWSVLADDDSRFSPWALVNNRLAKFTVNAPLSDKVPGALLDLEYTFDLDSAVLGLVDVTFIATVDPALPVDSVTVVIGEPRKNGLRRTLNLAPGDGDTFTAVSIDMPTGVQYGFRGFATKDGVKGPPTERYSLTLNEPIGLVETTADTEVKVTLPADADPDANYDFLIAEHNGQFFPGRQQKAVAGSLTIPHEAGQEIATAGQTYYVRLRPTGVFGAWTDWMEYTP